MKKYIVFALLAALMCSCVSVKETVSTFEPKQTELKIVMQDLEYLGDLTLTVDYTKYGAIKRITKVNGEPYNPRFTKELTVNNINLSSNSPLKVALYKIYETYPDVSYCIPSSYYVVKNNMHTGGAYVTETMKVKVYKLK